MFPPSSYYRHNVKGTPHKCIQIPWSIYHKEKKYFMLFIKRLKSPIIKLPLYLKLILRVCCRYVTLHAKNQNHDLHCFIEHFVIWFLTQWLGARPDRQNQGYKFINISATAEPNLMGFSSIVLILKVIEHKL